MARSLYKESRAEKPCFYSGEPSRTIPRPLPRNKKAFSGFFIKKLVHIKIIDTEIIIAYNKSTKKHTIFGTERSVLYVSCKEHGC